MPVVDEPSRPRLPRHVREGAVVAIVRGASAQRAVDIAGVLLDAGLRCVEITLDGPDGVAAVASVAARHGKRMTLAAGTVLESEQAVAAWEAGAEMIVSPHVDTQLVAKLAADGIPTVPGAYTTTEVLSAWRAGASAVKLFPAGVAGAGYVSAIQAPLGNVPLIPTGGITAENAGGFLDAGALTVGVGNWLTGGPNPEARIRQRAPQLLAATRADRHVATS